MKALFYTLVLLLVGGTAHAGNGFDASRIVTKTEVLGNGVGLGLKFEFSILKDQTLWVRRLPEDGTPPRMIKIFPFIARDFFTLNKQTYLTVSEAQAPNVKYLVHLTPDYGLQLSGRGPYLRWFPRGKTWFAGVIGIVASAYIPIVGDAIAGAAALMYLAQLWRINGAYLQAGDFDVARSLDRNERLIFDEVKNNLLPGENKDVTLRSDGGYEYSLAELQKSGCENMMGGHAPAFF